MKITEKDKEKATIIERLVNDGGFSPRSVSKALVANMHRYLRGQFAQLCLNFLIDLAEEARKGHYDDRDVAMAQTAEDILSYAEHLVESEPHTKLAGFLYCKRSYEDSHAND